MKQTNFVCVYDIKIYYLEDDDIDFYKKLFLLIKYFKKCILYYSNSNILSVKIFVYFKK